MIDTNFICGHLKSQRRQYIYSYSTGTVYKNTYSGIFQLVLVDPNISLKFIEELLMNDEL